MLHIFIRFESSLTNQLLNDHKEPLFTSSKGFGAGLRKLNKVSLDPCALPNQTLVHHVRKLNAENPNMTFQVPKDYDNTVRGIVARLCGEVRRINDLEDDHPLHSIWSSMEYELNVQSEHSEVYALATPPNELQNSGAGLIPAGNPFYTPSVLARKILGHLEHPFSDQMEPQHIEGLWSPKTPYDLVNRLGLLKKEQDELTAAKKKEMGDAYISPLSDYERWLKTEIAVHAPGLILSNIDYWNLAGSRIALNVLTLPREERDVLIEAGFLSRNGNLPGIAMSGGLGNTTPKDVYAGAGCKKAISTLMPYQAELWFDHNGGNHKVTVGAIKKTGTVHIKIDHPDDLDIAMRIKNCAVGPFQFGKKGLAYVQRMYTQ